MYRPRSKLIAPLTTMVIDPAEHSESDIEEDSPSVCHHPRGNPHYQSPALLSSITLRNRVEPLPHLNYKKQIINLDRHQPIFQCHPPQHHFIPQYSHSQSEESSVVIVPNFESPQCPRKKLRKMALVPNKIKLERKDQTSIECSICLSDLKSVEEKTVGRLQCGHLFCFKCILESSRFATKCPYCRTPYRQIYKGNRVVTVPEVVPNEDLDDPMDEPCYICGRNDDFEHLLECEYCQYAYCHTYCDNRLTSHQPPSQSWYCLSCQQLINNGIQNPSQSQYQQIYQQQS